MNAIEASMLNLKKQNISDTIASLRNQVDPHLAVVFGNNIDAYCTGIQQAILERQVHLNDVDLHRYFYKQTLKPFPRATFLATSIPYERFFWKNPQLDQAMSKFIERHGKIKRIFFIYDSRKLDKEEVGDILRRQCNMGVEVYTTEATLVPPHLIKFVLVETKGRIAWEAHIGPDNQITHVIATSNPEAINSYTRMFSELFGLHGTRRYVCE